MRSPIAALLWERIRLSWWYFLPALGVTLLSILTFGLGDNPRYDEWPGQAITLFAFLALVSLLTVVHGTGDDIAPRFPRSRYRLPVRTSTLAAVHYLYGAALVIIFWVSVVALFASLCPHGWTWADFPLLLFFALLFHLCMTLSAWAIGPLNNFAAILVGLGCGLFLLITHDILTAGEKTAIPFVDLLAVATRMAPATERPTGYVVASFWSLVAGGAGLGMLILTADRRSALDDLTRPATWIRISRREKFSRFESALQAQSWYEQRRGLRLFFWSLCAVAAPLCLAMSGFYFMYRMYQATIAHQGNFQQWVFFYFAMYFSEWIDRMLAMSLMFAFFVGLYRFILLQREHVSGQSNFDLLRPQTVSQVARARRRAVLKSLMLPAIFGVVLGLAGFSMIAARMLLASNAMSGTVGSFVYNQADLARLIVYLNPIIWLSATVGLVALWYVCLHQAQAILAFFGSVAFLYAALSGVLYVQGYRVVSEEWYMGLAAITMGVVYAGLVAVAAIRALRLRLITGRSILYALAVWPPLAYAMAIFSTFSDNRAIVFVKPEFLPFGLLAALFAIAPVMTTPVILHWQRHR